jgi:hypothetical protein
LDHGSPVIEPITSEKALHRLTARKRAIAPSDRTQALRADGARVDRSVAGTAQDGEAEIPFPFFDKGRERGPLSVPLVAPVLVEQECVEGEVPGASGQFENAG